MTALDAGVVARCGRHEQARSVLVERTETRVTDHNGYQPHAARYPVDDQEQRRPQILELPDRGHASSFLNPWRHDG